MRIRAKDLYDAVWAKPVRTLAKEWGLSDVGLAKVCRKYGIPLPRVGHWAKVTVGRGYPRPPYTGDPNIEISFEGTPSLKRPVLTQEAQQKLAPAVKAIADLPVEEERRELAYWTKKTAKALDKKPDPSGFLVTSKEAFKVSISNAARERAIQILNKLEIALSAAGVVWEADEKRHMVVGKMHGETLAFELAERYSRTEHIKKHPTYSWMDEKTYTYTFSGDLAIRIDGWYEGRKSWADGKTKRLEEKLPEVIEGFLAAAEAMRQRTIEREEQKRRWAEEERQRVERERVAREEKAFLEATIKDANNWAQANTIRQYAAHLRKLIGDQNIQLTDAGVEWLAKIERSADRLDPVRRHLEL